MRLKTENRAVWGWALYDWANSAFATSVMAGFFPVFFKNYWSVGVDVNTSTARLGFGNSAASLTVALIAPLVGAVADSGSLRKRFLLIFAYWGVLCTAALFFIPGGRWELALALYALAILGFSGANIFYDALLLDVAGEKNVDAVSSAGYALGYLGGGLLLLGNVLMIRSPESFGLRDAPQALRVSFLTVALWWAFFSLFTARWLSAGRMRRGGNGGAMVGGFRQLAGTFRRIRHLKMVLLFLLAYWCYIDGVGTVMRMAVDYGLALGFSSDDLILALLIVQFIGFPSALGFGRLGQWWGVRRSIFLAIGAYAAITVWAMVMSSKQEFYGLAAAVGLVQGGIQALSRSFYSRLIPKEKAGEFFGFYNMLGRFAAISGPALMGGAALLSRYLLMPPSPTPEQIEAVGQTASRFSIGALLLLFAAGALLLGRVDEKRGKSEAAKLS